MKKGGEKKRTVVDGIAKSRFEDRAKENARKKAAKSGPRELLCAISGNHRFLNRVAQSSGRGRARAAWKSAFESAKGKIGEERPQRIGLGWIVQKIEEVSGNEQF